MGFLEDQQREAERSRTPNIPNTSNTQNSIYNNSQTILQRELEDGERLLWSGNPNRKRMSNPKTAVVVFAVLFTLFGVCVIGVPGVYIADFADGTGINTDVLPMFCMIFFIFPLLILIIALVSGKNQGNIIFYGVTDRRIIVLSNTKIKQVISYGFDDLPFLKKSVRDDGSGTIRFGHDPIDLYALNQNCGSDYIHIRNRTHGHSHIHVYSTPRLNLFSSPILYEIENVENVYDIISSRIRVN